MIDFHCHLDLYPNPKEILDGITCRKCFVLSVTTTPMAWDGTKALIGDNLHVKIAAGLHPELIKSRYQETDILCELLSETNYVGEIGLDGSAQNKNSLDLQQKALTKIIRECERLDGKILSIHSRGAVSAVIELLNISNRKSIPVLHWFTGTPREANKAINIGCWFSVCPPMLNSKNGKNLLELIPRDRLLTETDGPFTQNNGKPLMPWDVRNVHMGVADIWKCRPEEVQSQIAENFKKLTCEELQL